MMFAGFGVTLRDLPSYLKWGSHISYLRYGLEGFVGAIYGEGRGVLDCNEAPYCHYRCVIENQKSQNTFDTKYFNFHILQIPEEIPGRDHYAR